MPTLQIILTDGNGVQGLTATFGAIIQSNIIQTSADAAAAAQSASNAATSATAAASSASNAAVSATSASSSATAAANSASAASTSATDASNSATSAATSATNSANSATSASTSATNAANSATSAANSAAQASATLASALVKTNNLSDVASASTAATNLGLGTGNTPTFTNVKLSSSSAHGVAVGQAGAGMTFVAPGATAGLPLVTNGSTADPTYQVLPIAGGGTGANTAAGALSALGTQPTNNPTFTGNVGVPTRTPGDSSANAAATAFVAAAIAPFTGKNRIINGTCSVAQRGNQAHGASTFGYSAVDRFYVNTTAGVAVNSAQVPVSIIGSAAGEYALALSGSSGTGAVETGQRIESLNITDLAGQQVTMSFYAYSTLSTGVSLTAITPSSSADNYGSTTAVTGIPTLPSLAATTWTKYTASFTLPNSAIYGLQVALDFASIAPGQTIYVSRVQCESGSIATPTERRQYAVELMLCQRYYEIGNVPPNYMQLTGSIFLSAAMAPFCFKVTKRVTPSVSFSNVSYYSNGNPTSLASGNYFTAGATTTGAAIYLSSGMTNGGGLSAAQYVSSCEI